METSFDPIRVLVADDHPLFRAGVTQSLSSEPDLMVIGQAEDGKTACNLAIETRPDVVLLDIVMPGQSGIETARQISLSCSTAKILMLTVSEDQDDLMSALKVGARGYVLKGVSARELANAVRAVAVGEVYISSALASNILFEMTHGQPTTDPLDELTDREHQILNLVSEGLTNREIGEHLHLAEKTIKHYMTNVLQKLHVRSRVEAALFLKDRALNH